MKTQEILDEVISLPVDLRTELVDKILNTINPAREEIDKLWAVEAEKRVEEIRSGAVEPVDGPSVFQAIRDKRK